MAMQAPSKKKKDKNRHVYITERIRYLKYDVPSIDTVVEEDKLMKKLVVAQEQQDWKLEAQALMQLGQLMKWKGQVEKGDEYLARSASLLRKHTFADDDDEANE